MFSSTLLFFTDQVQSVAVKGTTSWSSVQAWMSVNELKMNDDKNKIVSITSANKLKCMSFSATVTFSFPDHLES